MNKNSCFILAETKKQKTKKLFPIEIENKLFLSQYICPYEKSKNNTD
jgi:hypothetical protein